MACCLPPRGVSDASIFSCQRASTTGTRLKDLVEVVIGQRCTAGPISCITGSARCISQSAIRIIPLHYVPVAVFIAHPKIHRVRVIVYVIYMILVQGLQDDALLRCLYPGYASPYILPARVRFVEPGASVFPCQRRFGICRYPYVFSL